MLSKIADQFTITTEELPDGGTEKRIELSEERIAGVVETLIREFYAWFFGSSEKSGN